MTTIGFVGAKVLVRDRRFAVSLPKRLQSEQGTRAPKPEPLRNK